MPQDATPQGLGLELVAPRPYTHPNIQGRTSAELAATAHQANRKSLFHHPMQRTSPSPPTQICNASRLRAMPLPAEQAAPGLRASPAPSGHFVQNSGNTPQSQGISSRTRGNTARSQGNHLCPLPLYRRRPPAHNCHQQRNAKTARRLCFVSLHKLDCARLHTCHFLLSTQPHAAPHNSLRKQPRHHDPLAMPGCESCSYNHFRCSTAPGRSQRTSGIWCSYPIQR